MNRSTLALLAASLAATTALAQDAPSPSSDEAEVGKLREQMVDAFNKGDMDRLLACCDPDVVSVWQNNEVCQGREALRAFYQRVFVGPDRLVEKVTSNPQVEGRRISGDRAVSWGQFHDSYVRRDGTTFDLNSRFTATLAKHDGTWSVVAFHASSNVFDNPILTAGVKQVAIWAGIAAGGGGIVLGAVIGAVVARHRRAGA